MRTQETSTIEPQRTQRTQRRQKRKRNLKPCPAMLIPIFFSFVLSSSSVPSVSSVVQFLFLEPLAPQDVVVVLREAVRLVADVLQQPQRRRVTRQTDRLRLAGAV